LAIGIFLGKSLIAVITIMLVIEYIGAFPADFYGTVMLLCGTDLRLYD